MTKNEFVKITRDILELPEVKECEVVDPKPDLPLGFAWESAILILETLIIRG